MCVWNTRHHHWTRWQLHRAKAVTIVQSESMGGGDFSTICGWGTLQPPTSYLKNRFVQQSTMYARDRANPPNKMSYEWANLQNAHTHSKQRYNTANLSTCGDTSSKVPSPHVHTQPQIWQIESVKLTGFVASYRQSTATTQHAVTCMTPCTHAHIINPRAIVRIQHSQNDDVLVLRK